MDGDHFARLEFFESLQPQKLQSVNNLAAAPGRIETVMPYQHTESEGAPPSPLQSTSDMVILQVGDRRFTTTKSTLMDGSDWFSSFFSGRWNHELRDGAYFIDADGDLFEHILRYLRRKILPIFYDNAKGHDHALYLALLKEAEYFQIERLRLFVERREYLTAVMVAYSVTETKGPYQTWSELSDTELQHVPFYQVKRVYMCPRGIWAHNGNPKACGQQCRSAQGGVENEFSEEQVLKVVVIKKSTNFDWTRCVDMYPDSDVASTEGDA